MPAGPRTDPKGRLLEVAQTYGADGPDLVVPLTHGGLARQAR
jgi:hypothetical protein